jgi:uncharacterized membrane protein YeaQ/YmgE (transglycosylase-associated protein family)
MNLLVTLIIGGIVGWVASILMRTNARMGILANVVVGIVGSILGTALANAGGMRIGAGLESWIMAVVGAAVLIGILKSLGVFSRVHAWR